MTDMVKDEVLEEILQMPVAEARGKMVDEVNRMGAEDNAIIYYCGDYIEDEKVPFPVTDVKM